MSCNPIRALIQFAVSATLVIEHRATASGVFAAWASTFDECKRLSRNPPCLIPFHEHLMTFSPGKDRDSVRRLRGILYH
jgi:hypothetical protein